MRKQKKTSCHLKKLCYSRKERYSTGKTASCKTSVILKTENAKRDEESADLTGGNL